jgi:hypothetical protein
MPAIAAIYTHSGLVGDEAVMALTALTNSATVAQDGTFTPDSSPAPGVTRWVDKRDGIPSCYPYFTFQMRPPVRQSKVYRMNARLVLPVAESDLGPASNGVTPGPMKAYELSANLDVQIPERSTLADRRKLLSGLVALMVRSLKASDLSPAQDTGSPIPKAILDLEGVWGT